MTVGELLNKIAMEAPHPFANVIVDIGPDHNPADEIFDVHSIFLDPQGELRIFVK